MTPLITAVLLFLFAILVLILYLLASRRSSGHRRTASSVAGTERHCPLCGSPLEGREKVRSVVYPGKGDRITEVYGCPHCYPANSEIVRICPVCKAGLKPDGYVIGRLFERPDKQHLHVLGCTGCYRGSSGKR